MRIASIPGQPGYLASDDGRIFSDKRGRRRQLAAHPDKDGYFCVILCQGGHRVNWKVHALVALTFIGERPQGQQVRHLNGVRTDNRSVNLAYGTDLENKNDARRHGTLPVGEQNGRAQLTEDVVRELRRRCGAGERQKDVAVALGVSHLRVNTISYAVRGITWGHVT